MSYDREASRFKSAPPFADDQDGGNFLQQWEKEFSQTFLRIGIGGNFAEAEAIISPVVDVIKLFFGGNLEIIDFPWGQNSNNRIF